MDEIADDEIIALYHHQEYTEVEGPMFQIQNFCDILSLQSLLVLIGEGIQTIDAAKDLWDSMNSGGA